MKFGLTTEEISLIHNVFAKHTQITRAFIYGSRATNTFTRTSDIDLAIELAPNHKNITSTIKDQLNDLHIIYSIDLINHNLITDESLYKEYQRTKKIFYIKGWKTTTLGAVANKVHSGGTPSTSNKKYYIEGDIPWLRTQEVNFNYIYSTDIKITNEALANSSAKWVPKNSVIIAMYGESAGRVALTKINLTTNQACCNFILDIDRSNYHFIYFNLLSRYSEIKNMATGAAQQNLNQLLLTNLSLSLPPLGEQNAIAAVLSSLDDKIELLREQSKTLEAIAQTIFKEWFVKFNYPGATGRMVDSELGKIPKGWKIGKIKYDIKTILGGTPSRANNLFWDTGSIPWINSGAINNFPIMRASEYITEDGLKNSAAKLMPAKTVVLPFVITRGSEIKVSFLGIESSGNQSVLGLLETEKFSCGYIYFWIQQMKNKLYSCATGGAQQHINKQEVENLELLIPTHKVLESFNVLSYPVFEKIIENSFQIQTLSTFRDSLLPKLMSGEVRIKGFGN
ncbi:MAG: restriction endonuclease subunit S [Methylacidiphilales bacterium]|nr:restriction endonuclease subunit S [Candidatus Methylacidiphilales bacterium]